MELQCPQCGKWMAVSKEELLMHDSQVVCPQCLAVCRYENDTLVVRDDSDAPYRHTATVAEAPHATTRFCHSCGKQLPHGIRFCPYCGADLEAPFDQSTLSVKQQPLPQPQPEPEPVPKEEKKRAASKQESRVHSTGTHTEPRFEDKLRTIARRYDDSGMHLHQHGTMPGPVFKIVAYTVIVLLLALLVYLIYSGISIETTV